MAALVRDFLRHAELATPTATAAGPATGAHPVDPSGVRVMSSSTVVQFARLQGFRRAWLRLDRVDSGELGTRIGTRRLCSVLARVLA
jgi:hypothetical protein